MLSPLLDKRKSVLFDDILLLSNLITTCRILVVIFAVLLSFLYCAKAKLLKRDVFLLTKIILCHTERLQVSIFVSIALEHKMLKLYCFNVLCSLVGINAFILDDVNKKTAVF